MNIERYNRTVRTEWLGRYHFETIEDVQDQATRWLWTYNNDPSDIKGQMIVDTMQMNVNNTSNFFCILVIEISELGELSLEDRTE